MAESDAPADVGVSLTQMNDSANPPSEALPPQPSEGERESSSSSSSSLTPTNKNAVAKTTAPSSTQQQQQQLSAAHQQMAKLRDANAKYKSLLKMAKERIQSQEDELEKLRLEMKRIKDDLAAEQEKNAVFATSRINRMGSMGDDMQNGGGIGDMGGENSWSIVRVCQRIKVEIDDDDEEEFDMMRGTDAGVSETLDRRALQGNGIVGDGEDSAFEIWALIEYESFNPDLPDPNLAPRKRYRRWRRFASESALSDFIRRDTGEPLMLPPYSLSPEQSAQIEEEARQAVSHVTEEFRRFRVRAEVARKQADATVRALHNSNVQSTKRRIEGHDLEKELEQARTEHAQLASLRAEMAEQEAHWKEAYDVLLAENNALKSAGAEATLAAQWRQRYEACLAEKDDLEARLKMEHEKAEELEEHKRKADAGKYEMKYRDLKESFRLYRKKAKEIFEAQQRGDVEILNLSDKGTEEAKMEYLRNLMVNYLTSDPAVREHMEAAIFTVLKFSPEEIAKIEKKKGASDTWF